MEARVGRSLPSGWIHIYSPHLEDGLRNRMPIPRSDSGLGSSSRADSGGTSAAVGAHHMRSSLLAYVTSACCFALVLSACSGEGPSIASDSANVDSFAKPTELGALMFGTPNPAELTETSRFHAWTFTLSESATLDLSTQIHT